MRSTQSNLQASSMALVNEISTMLGSISIGIRLDSKQPQIVREVKDLTNVGVVVPSGQGGLSSFPSIEQEALKCFIEAVHEASTPICRINEELSDQGRATLDVQLNLFCKIANMIKKLKATNIISAWNTGMMNEATARLRIEKYLEWIIEFLNDISIVWMIRCLELWIASKLSPQLMEGKDLDLSLTGKFWRST
ncbi:hypothetical protein FA15DRAFT_652966 [Coprinopsis marcescibilis]|uniref:Uncharacterized protein n=1 Tax=Coprinopsis marcescibilis TaxID=230819 RepID=A0A5C3L8C7_COPMA|nr:hypothetical protein FA15DRAFT_652966 [Coprinopsis marcescibilis]